MKAIVRFFLAASAALALALPALAHETPEDGSQGTGAHRKGYSTLDHGARDKKGRDYPDRFGIFVGAFRVKGIDIQAQVSPKNIPGVGAIINFNDDLGMDNNDDSFRIDGYYRFTPRHRIDFAWYETRVEGERTVTRNIEWNGQTYPVGARVSSFFEQTTYKVNYLFSFYHNEKVELGVGAGLHITDLATGLKVENISDVPILDPDINLKGDVSATAPLPVGSLLLEYRILPRFAVRLRNDWFALDYDGYKGVFIDSFVTFEYQVIRNMAIGLGWDRVKLDVTGDEDDRRWDVDVDYDGYMFYLKAMF